MAIPIALLSAKTKNDFDPDAPYAKFKTFSMVAGIDMAKTGLIDNPETRMRIANFVSGILENRGLREVPRDEKHDLAVRVWIAIRDKQSVTTVSYLDPMYSGVWGGYAPFWGGPWGYWYDEVIVRDYVEGTLIIDLLDPATKELVWRTYLKRDFDDRLKAHDQAQKELNKAFLAFPPSEKAIKEKRKERSKQASSGD